MSPDFKIGAGRRSTQVRKSKLLLVRAHARTGDIARIAGYIGKSDVFAAALAEFAEAYGNQTDRDHDALAAAIRSGGVAAVAE